MLHALEIASRKGNDILEQFIIGFNEGKREEILKFLHQRQEDSGATGIGRKPLPVSTTTTGKTNPITHGSGSAVGANQEIALEIAKKQ